MRKLVAVVFVVAAALSASLPVGTRGVAAQGYDYNTDTSKYRLPAAQAKTIIEGRAKEVLRALNNKDMARLSTFIHPRRGLRLAYYSWVDRDDKWLSKQQVRNILRSNRRSVWFYADEAGTPMRMTGREFLYKHLYDHDYLKATQVTYNTQNKRSNTIPNVLAFYPRAIVVEYFEPNSDPNDRGWDTLWLVFEKMGATWYLVAMVKDSPTM